MSRKIIDYTLNSLTPANPDGAYPATVAGCTVIAGPGTTTLGTYPQALDFGPGSQLRSVVPSTDLNATKFCLRLVFKIDGPVTARKTLAASSALPFELYVVPGSAATDFHLAASVETSAHGKGRASTEFFRELHTGTWYAADLAYDIDTLAVFVDGSIESVHAFPNGSIAPASGDHLLIGSGVGGSDPFEGAMAAIELHDDIPIELEKALDERRSHPQWFLTYKQEEMKSVPSFGDPLGEFFFDLPSESWIQKFSGGIIMYNDSNGQAFEMRGDILQAYFNLPVRAEIGYLISDQINGARNGVRKNLFNRGGIYSSKGTGAVPVVGQVWVDYESMGESASAIGAPVSPQASITGGIRQVFQGGEMYLRTGGAKAFAVQGAILSRYLASGGPATRGFPVTNEEDLLKDTTVIGRSSEFEFATIYWSSATGAYEVHGSIRDKYRNAGGPAGELGFPTSDETNIPGSGGRYNTFQNGSIVWFGSLAETYVCLAFDITLGRVNTVESEAIGRGQNDIYMYATIEDDGDVILSERLPSSGDWSGGNIADVNKTFDVGPAGIVPNQPNRIITFNLDVWDSDRWNDDDHLGEFSYTLDMANAWGLRGNPLGLFNSGKFDNINSITWSVSPRVDPGSLTAGQKWWGVRNQGTDPLTWEQYASAFRDVDSETEWWDPTDWLAALFYELVVDSLAKKGNCFGMSLESIYSKKDRSIFRMPIDRFKTWDDILRNEFNIKQQYQVGSSAIWWFIAQFVSGRTHDPVSVFRSTRAAYNAGCDPVLCISQNYDFSGSPHCILPIGWNDSVTPWQMLVRDPNFPSSSATSTPRVLEVDPVNNTYSYVGSSSYSGGEFSGGRMHYMPYNVLNDKPRTPIYEALMMLLSGVILIVGSDGETVTLTDENGVDLDAFGADSVSRLKMGAPLTNKFVSVKGFDSHTPDCAEDRPEPKPEVPPDKLQPRPPRGITPSELHMRCDPRVFSRTAPPNRRSGDDWRRLTLKEYLCQIAPADIRKKFAGYPDYVALNRGRLMIHLLDEPLLKGVLASGAAKTPGGSEIPSPVSKNYIHTVRGIRSGKLQYGLKKGMTQFLLTTNSRIGENHTIRVNDLGASTNSIVIEGHQNKEFKLEVHNRLGVGRNYVRMTIDKIPLRGGGKLELNLKPGLGGVEIVSDGQELKTTVQLACVIGRTELNRSYEVHEKTGIRIVPSTLVTGEKLKVSRIEKLFGESLSSNLLSSQP